MDISDHYKITGKIDEGAFGEVLLGFHKETKQKVAIKRLKSKVKSWNDCLEMREVKSLRKLNHDNVVKLKEARKVKSILYLVFEFAETNLFKMYISFKKKVPHLQF